MHAGAKVAKLLVIVKGREVYPHTEKVAAVILAICTQIDGGVLLLVVTYCVRVNFCAGQRFKSCFHCRTCLRCYVFLSCVLPFRGSAVPLPPWAVRWLCFVALTNIEKVADGEILVFLCVVLLGLLFLLGLLLGGLLLRLLFAARLAPK